MEDLKHIYKVLVESTMQEYKTIQGLYGAYDAVSGGMLASTNCEINVAKTKEYLINKLRMMCYGRIDVRKLYDFDNLRWIGDRGDFSYIDPYGSYSYTTDNQDLKRKIEAYEKSVRARNKIHHDLLMRAEEVYTDRARGTRNVTVLQISQLTGKEKTDCEQYVNSDGSLSYKATYAMSHDSEVIRLSNNAIASKKALDKWYNTDDNSSEKLNLCGDAVGLKLGELRKLISGVSEKIGYRATKEIVKNAWELVMHTEFYDSYNLFKDLSFLYRD